MLYLSYPNKHIEGLKMVDSIYKENGRFDDGGSREVLILYIG
jgi:hypothetical protein